MEDTCTVYLMGCMDYQEAWNLQNQIAQGIASGSRSGALLLLEHPHTYTIGRRGGWSHVIWDEDLRREKGIKVYEVDRGGDITYHGPGQLVGYPLLPLAAPGWQGQRLPQADFVGYLRRLEEVLIQACASLGLVAQRRDGYTGVWLPAAQPSEGGPRKLASIGVKVDAKGVSRHGFALNVHPDMTYWQGIVPCGLDGVKMAALQDLLDPAPTMEATVQAVIESFAKVFNLKIRIIREGGF